MSSGNIAAPNVTVQAEPKAIDNPNTIQVKSRISSIEPIVELSYTLGDNLHFKASSQGYVSQGLYASPSGNQTITFFLT